MSDRQDRFAGAGPVSKGLEIDPDAVTDIFSARISGISPPLSIQQFRGGQSNPTYLITDSRDRRFVLRRKPPGKLLKSAHAVDREYRIIKSLAATDVPVPAVRFLCEDPEVIGSTFFVMDYVDGRIFWDASLPELARDERDAVYDQMNKTIAALHSTDFKAIGLGDYGKPGNYFARQISRWSRQYLSDEAADRIEAMDRLVDWLPENIPSDETTSIVHGDFRLDNAIFDRKQPELIAVLDWELSTLGHPLADFAYACLPYRLPPDSFSGLLGLDLDAAGIPDEGEFVRRYCQRTRRDGIPDFDFYIAFNLFRLAAILHGILGRVKRGTAASAHAEQQGAFTSKLAELGWEQAEMLDRRRAEI